VRGRCCGGWRERLAPIRRAWNLPKGSIVRVAPNDSGGRQIRYRSSFRCPWCGSYLCVPTSYNTWFFYYDLCLTGMIAYALGARGWILLVAVVLGFFPVAIGTSFITRDNGEALFSRRCTSEEHARYCANGLKQDELKAGWLEIAD